MSPSFGNLMTSAICWWFQKYVSIYFLLNKILKNRFKILIFWLFSQFVKNWDFLNIFFLKPGLTKKFQFYKGSSILTRWRCLFYARKLQNKFFKKIGAATSKSGLAIFFNIFLQNFWLNHFLSKNSSELSSQNWRFRA